MSKLNLPEPQDLALSLLKNLPERNQEILKRRYGLIDNHPQTLEAIGKTYQITRERVRQIVEASLKIIKNSPQMSAVTPFWSQAKNLLRQLGGLEEENDFLVLLQKKLELEKSTLSTLKFLLLLNPEFCLENEDDNLFAYWHLKELSRNQIQATVKKLEEFFKKQKQVATPQEILSWAKQNISSDLTEDTIRIYLKLMKTIGVNPFGEYGLRNWSKIEPAGARDRAYLLLSHEKKPLHFTEIAKSLNEQKEVASPLILSRSWLKKVEVQTVHNELIKDPRFVLIGRGIYALRDWGYKPGKVADVIKEVLKEAKKPLTQEEIIQEVQKRRFTKPNTIILNLHNKKLFKKVDEKRYTLAREEKILEV